MKKLGLILFLMVFAVSANYAQLAVGGSLGFESYGNKTIGGGTTVENYSGSDFEISPLVGFFISDKLMAGVQLSLTMGSFLIPGDPVLTIPDRKTKSTGIGVSPFARYYLIQKDKISVFGQAGFDLEMIKSSTKIGTTTNDNPKVSDVTIYVKPGVAFELTEKIELEALINVFNLYYNQNTETDISTGVEIKDIDNGFGIGAGTDVGVVSLGLLIKL